MRVFLPIVLIALLAGCGREPLSTPATAPMMKTKILDREVAAIAERARPGVLGVGVVNLGGGESWSFNDGRPFPLQSVFKAPLGAAVLAAVDRGQLSLDEVVTLEAKDISPPYSPVADAWPARSAYTVRELLVAAVGQSDNTAADVLMKKIGGPGAVQAWLTENRVPEMRIDRYERELQVEVAGLASFRPAWKGEAAFVRAVDSLPPARRRAALAAYLRDPRDTSTVAGALVFLRRLMMGDLLSPRSSALLLKIMTDTTTGPGRLEAGLPDGASLAHKTGTARTVLGVNPAVNDMGVVTLKDGRRYAVVVFLSGSTAPEAERDAMIADVARAIVKASD